MKVLLSILLLTFSTNNYIVESKFLHKTLKWSDFKIKKSVDNTAAESVTEIGYIYDGNSKVTVLCNFSNTESYVIAESRNEYILNHEQKHYDITYIYAKKFANILKIYEQVNAQLIDDIYVKIISEKDSMQNQYDFETNHSINIIKQKEWDNKITKMINGI